MSIFYQIFIKTPNKMILCKVNPNNKIKMIIAIICNKLNVSEDIFCLTHNDKLLKPFFQIKKYLKNEDTIKLNWKIPHSINIISNHHKYNIEYSMISKTMISIDLFSDNYKYRESYYKYPLKFNKKFRLQKQSHKIAKNIYIPSKYFDTHVLSLWTRLHYIFKINNFKKKRISRPLPETGLDNIVDKKYIELLDNTDIKIIQKTSKLMEFLKNKVFLELLCSYICWKYIRGKDINDIIKNNLL